MPCYEYQCENCTAVFELFRSMAEMDAAAMCPACRSLLTRRLLSIPTILGKSRRETVTSPNNAHQTHRSGCRCCVPHQS